MKVDGVNRKIHTTIDVSIGSYVQVLTRKHFGEENGTISLTRLMVHLAKGTYIFSIWTITLSTSDLCIKF